MSSPILQLPSEALGRICYFLSNSSCLSVLSLHPLLSSRLLSAQGLKSYYVLRTEDESPFVHGNPNFSRFRGLVSLKLILPDLSSSYPVNYLTSLPSTLRLLEMRFNFALYAWHSPAIEYGSSVQALSMAKICPELETLILGGDMWELIPAHFGIWTPQMHAFFIQNLPTTLRTLFISPFPTDLHQTCLLHLTNIEELTIRAKDDFYPLQMPQSLTRFNITNLKSLTSPWINSLPESLHHLQVSVLDTYAYQSPPIHFELPRLLPKSLHTLDVEFTSKAIWDPFEPHQWPSNLKKLKFFGRTISDLLPLFAKLPASLTHLEIASARDTLGGLTFLPDSTVMKLPALLETFIIVSDFHMLTSSDLTLLPKTLRHLDVNYKRDTTDNGNPFPLLSSQLETFYWNVSDETGILPVLSSIPTTLTSLKLRLSRNVNQQEFSQLPRHITQLQLEGAPLVEPALGYLPTSIHFVLCSTLLVTGHYASEAELQNKTSLKQSALSRWSHRFPSCAVPKAEFLSVDVPPHCTELDLGEPCTVNAASLFRTSRLTSLKTVDLSFSTSKMVVSVSTNGKYQGSEHVEQDNALETGIQFFTPTLTRLELMGPSDGLKDIVSHLSPTLKVLIALESTCLGPLTSFPFELEVLKLGSNWVLNASNSEELVIFPPRLTELSLNRIDTWFTSLLPESLLHLSVCNLSHNPKTLKSGNASKTQQKVEDSSYFAALPRKLLSFSTPYRTHLDYDNMNGLPPKIVDLELSAAHVPIEALDLLPKSVRLFQCSSLCLSSLEWASHFIEPNAESVILEYPVLRSYLVKRNAQDAEHQSERLSVQVAQYACDFDPSEVTFLPQSTTYLYVAPNSSSERHGTWKAKFFEKTLPNLKRLDLGGYFITEISIPALPSRLIELKLNGEHPHHPELIQALSSKIYEILPNGLQMLTIASAPVMEIENAKALPPGLLILSLTIREGCAAPINKKVISSLPRSIKTLDIPETDLYEESIPDLPPNLTKLNIFLPNAPMRRYISVLDFGSTF